ncbi:MAG: arabinofuranosyltransferase [bacterium]
MNELSLQTINIIAYSKIILLAVFILTILIARRKCNKPWLISLLASIAVSGFYLVLAYPLQKMWWGNNGDEIFVISFLSRVLSGNPFNDFYYRGLPQFYPPLYFWLTGFLSMPFTKNAINAAKIGVAATFSLWFAGIYLWQKIYYKYIKQASQESIVSNPWFWTATPIILFFLLDFNDIILKPYETFSALALVFLTGMIAQEFSENKWTWKHYIFFGLSGGFLFLTYYFWWFIAIPALFVLILLSDKKRLNFFRTTCVGAIMFALSSIYLIPLFFSYLNGTENWQAVFFIPKDFTTFLPFCDISWRTPLIIAGIIGLIICHKKAFIKANIILLACCYGYQFISIFLFVFGKKPLQAAKPFLFLGTAAIAVGCGYLIIELWKKFILQLSKEKQNLIVFAVILLSLPYWPMAKFIDDPVAASQIEKDLQKPTRYYLAPEIKKAVPDYLDKTWLSSGVPEINAYTPLHYFLAHNPHFSHPAAKYSERLSIIKKLSQASPEEFKNGINQTSIDALLLYNAKSDASYPLFLWEDNYPNGGKEARIYIPKENIEKLNWQKKYENWEWIIYIK